MDCSFSRLLCPWDSPGNNTGVGCHALLQGIFPTRGLNIRLLHWQTISLPLVPPGLPWWLRGGQESASVLETWVLWRAVPCDEQSPANSRTFRWLGIYTEKGGQGVRKGQKENLDTGRMERGWGVGGGQGLLPVSPRTHCFPPWVTTLVKSPLLIRRPGGSPCGQGLGERLPWFHRSRGDRSQ